MRKRNLLRMLTPRWLRSRAASGDTNDRSIVKVRTDEVVALEYQWINNEQLLREEGAVYGMLGQGLNEKLEVIQNYFNKVLAALKVQISGEEKALATLLEQEKKLQKQLDANQSALDHFPAKTAKEPHYFWRSFTGFLIYLLIVGATFYIVYLWLLPEFAQHTILVSLGVFSFGALSLFGHFPLLLNAEHTVQKSDQRENWKLILEEIGIPVVATIFIISFGAPHHPWWHSIAMFPFILFVFLFAGKGLLASITALMPQWRTLTTNREQQTTYRTGKKEINTAIEQTSTNLKNIEKAIQEKHTALDSLRKAYAEAQIECETRKSYFISEFSLAENSRVRYNFFD